MQTTEVILCNASERACKRCCEIHVPTISGPWNSPPSCRPRSRSPDERHVFAHSSVMSRPRTTIIRDRVGSGDPAWSSSARVHQPGSIHRHGTASRRVLSSSSTSSSPTPVIESARRQGMSKRCPEQHADMEKASGPCFGGGEGFFTDAVSQRKLADVGKLKCYPRLLNVDRMWASYTPLNSIRPSIRHPGPDGLHSRHTTACPRADRAEQTPS